MENVMLIKEGKRTFTKIPSPENPDQLQAVRDLLGCHSLEAVALLPDLTIWVDGEGLFKTSQTMHTVAFAHNNQVAYLEQLAGSVLLTSCDSVGAMIGFDDEMKEMVERNFRLINTEVKTPDDE